MLPNILIDWCSRITGAGRDLYLIMGELHSALWKYSIYGAEGVTLLKEVVLGLIQFEEGTGSSLINNSNAFCITNYVILYLLYIFPYCEPL